MIPSGIQERDVQPHRLMMATRLNATLPATRLLKIIENRCSPPNAKKRRKIKRILNMHHHCPL